MSKITREELSDSLLTLIESNDNVTNSLIQKRNIVNVTSETSEVNIGISDFDRTTDVLMVFKNSVFIAEGDEYTISDDNIKIIKISDTWNKKNTNMSFVFLVFKNIPLVENTGIHTSMIKDGTINIDKLNQLIIDKFNEIRNIKTSIINLENEMLLIKESLPNTNKKM